jgi:hypothetical protein
MLIVSHLGLVLTHVVAAPSGPWPTQEGPDNAPPPILVETAHDQLALPYLGWLKLTHNYHFPTNRVGQPEARLEVRLLDEDGQAFRTLSLPDPKAPARVRQRQALLASWLTEDQPVAPRQGERIPAPSQKVPTVSVWEPVPNENRLLHLGRVPENELPRDRPVFRPSVWSLVLVRSLARHLCRSHGAQHAEITRRSREAIPPRVLFAPEAPPEMEDLQSVYGRLPR